MTVMAHYRNQHSEADINSTSVCVFFFFFWSFFAFSRATPLAYGGSQARGLIGAVATGLRQSHSNAGFELRL